MSKKHALVVDDSESARTTLQGMLAEYDMTVDVAVSAEDALDYLSHTRPDVIFMDHMMPGMDGLQAVKTIKEDPTTAMIPIMMYTSKNGEVYVSEARALGAVGVLSKEVKPVELLKVLRALHLVEDPDSPDMSGIRHAHATFVERETGAGIKSEFIEGAPHSPADGYENESVRRLVKSLLQEQRSQLRKDFIANAETLARKMAIELAEQIKASATEIAKSDSRNLLASLKDIGSLKLTILGLLGLVLVLGLFHIYLNAEGYGNARRQDYSAVYPADLQSALAKEGKGTRGVSQEKGGDGVTGENQALYEAIEWAVNNISQYPYDQVALGEETLNILQGLLPKLAAAGFKGTLRLDTHLAQFCLKRNEFNVLELPQDNTPMSECEVSTMSGEEAEALGEQQSLAFANFLASSPVLNRGDVRIEIVSHGREKPALQPPPMETAITAGDWNRIARLNNRVEFTFLHAPP